MSVIRISHPTGEICGTVVLDGSKSISNRVLLIRALCSDEFKIHHLSTSDDTRLLDHLLKQKDNDIYDVGHAGTTYRFLTAYLSLQPGTQILTGSSRMLERPIGPLVNALRMLGCNINYEGKEGYPPLKIGPPHSTQLASEVIIDSGISSQYITALIFIAPTLPSGLTIKLTGDMVSESYLELTLGIIRDFGIEVTYEDKKISINHQRYRARDYTIEADWSASSYHYVLAALADKAELRLKALFNKSLQGDAEMVNIGKLVGVSSEWRDGGWNLGKSPVPEKFSYDFINQPDVAQSLAVICAACEIQNEFSGLKTLRIKETDRISAMNCELEKVNSSFKQIKKDKENSEYYRVSPGISWEGIIPRFDTYEDHRMAMCLAPLALLNPIEINNPEVVSKSYPAFWKDMESLGFKIEEIDN